MKRPAFLTAIILLAISDIKHLETRYNIVRGKINSLSMDAYGNALAFSKSYISKETVRKKIDRKIRKLRPGFWTLKKSDPRFITKD